MRLDPRTGVIICRHVKDEGQPILFLSHDEDDGGFQVLCDPHREHRGAEEAAIVCLGHLPLEVIEVLEQLDIGQEAKRTTATSPWLIEGSPDTCEDSEAVSATC